MHFLPVDRFCSIRKAFGQSTPILIPSSTLPMFHVHENLVSPVLLKARPPKPSLTYERGQYSRSILIFTISTDLLYLKNHSIVTKARSYDEAPEGADHLTTAFILQANGNGSQCLELLSPRIHYPQMLRPIPRRCKSMPLKEKKW